MRRWTWYDDRLTEIPERLVKYWAEYLRKQPSLSLDDAASLALALRDEQLGTVEETLRDEGVILRDSHRFVASRIALERRPQATVAGDAGAH